MFFNDLEHYIDTYVLENLKKISNLFRKSRHICQVSGIVMYVTHTFSMR